MSTTASKYTVTAILSLSLLTVMAGAAIAPALEYMQSAFIDEPQWVVQMLISLPAVFIAVGSVLFPRVARIIPTKPLLLGALTVYVGAGCIAGVFNNIATILICRAFLGLATGIIMPLSTGLLAYYFDAEKQHKLMGYSSAMNQMGGVIATLATGILAAISWRASFLVYLMGLPCIILVALFLPDTNITATNQGTECASHENFAARFGQYKDLIIPMFLLMLTFFVYPSSYAMETTRAGVISPGLIAPIMALMDFIAFFGGLLFARIHGRLGEASRFVAPILFCLGYAMLFISDSFAAAIASAALVGFANGFGIPFIMSSAARRAGKAAATTVLPLLSLALYAAQFVTPYVLSLANLLALGTAVHIPYALAIVTAVLFGIASIFANRKLSITSNAAIQQQE